MIGSPDPVWSEKAVPLGEQADQLQKKSGRFILGTELVRPLDMILKKR
jgi:hypothetical protein